MLDLTGTNETTLRVDVKGDCLMIASGYDSEDRDVTVNLNAQSVARLTVSLLGWLNRQPAYSGLGLEIASKHLEAKVRQARAAS